MPGVKSNGLAQTWAKHNHALNGQLAVVLAVIQKLPGLVERNERYLVALERKRSKN